MNQLQKFQAAHCLEPDGDLGPITLKKMQSVFQISSKERMAHFAGQCAHESGGFTRESENLNYSYERLLQIFTYDFDKDKNRILSGAEKEFARILARKPEEIANFVYANQNGNGSELSGDGWKFRGRGLLQLTGRRNYELFSIAVNDPEIMCNPDIIIQKYYFESALHFFSSNNLWPLCNTVDTSSITKLTRRINGGTHGLQDRIDLTNKYYDMLRR